MAEVIQGLLVLLFLFRSILAALISSSYEIVQTSILIDDAIPHSICDRFYQLRFVQSLYETTAKIG